MALSYWKFKLAAQEALELEMQEKNCGCQFKQNNEKQIEPSEPGWKLTETKYHSLRIVRKSIGV